MGELSRGRQQDREPEDPKFETDVRFHQEFFPLKKESEIRKYLAKRKSIEALYKAVEAAIDLPPVLTRSQMVLAIEIFSGYVAWDIEQRLVDYSSADKVFFGVDLSLTALNNFEVVFSSAISESLDEALGISKVNVEFDALGFLGIL